MKNVLPKLEWKNLFHDIAHHDKQPAIYKDLIASLSALCIDALLISFEYRSISSSAVRCDKTDPNAKISNKDVYKTVPVLTIGINTHENYQFLNIDEHANNWSGAYFNTQSIRDIWMKLLCKYDHYSNDSYDKEMLVFFRDLAKDVATSLVYEMRNDVRKLVLSLPIIQPKEIYSSSAPGYNIVFSNKHEYKKADKQDQFRIMNNAILERITTEAPEKYKPSISEIVLLKFLYPEMNGFNWYGLARQD